MILDIFDKNFLRIDTISKYSFAQYTKPLCDTGNFEVDISKSKIPSTLMSTAKYILFEKTIMGEILYINSDSSKSYIVVKGTLLNRILSFRCFIRSKSFQGVRPEICSAMIWDNFLYPDDTARTISKLTVPILSEYLTLTDQIEMQATGGTVEQAIKDTLSDVDYGYEIIPIIGDVYNGSELVSNVSSLEFRVIIGADRSRYNTKGNDVVEFSLDLKNLLESTFTTNAVDYKNVAYVAGEGEGESRTVYKVSSISEEVSGLDRVEQYVDARDIRSTDESGITLTTEQYQKALGVRGYAKLSDCVIAQSFTAEIDTRDTKFVYGVDYKLGDIVSIHDATLPIVISAVVSSVTKSTTESGEKLDVTFGSYKVTLEDKLKRGGII